MKLPTEQNGLIQIGVSVHASQSLKHFQRCIDSCLSQESVDFILCIRTDGKVSNEILSYIKDKEKSDERVLLHESNEALGTYASYKLIFDSSDSQYLCQLDADDYLPPNALSLCLESFKKNPYLSFIYTQCITIDEEGAPLGLDRHAAEPYSSERLLISFITFHLRLINRYKYDLVGGYDETFKYAGDYDLCLRLSEVGDIMHISRPLYYYRVHKNSASQRHKNDVFNESLIASQRALIRRGMSSDYDISLLENGMLRLSKKTVRSTDNKSIHVKELINNDIFYISPIEAH